MAEVIGPMIESRAAVDRTADAAALPPYRYLVIGLDIDQDPTRVPGVPQEGSIILVDGSSYRCDKLQTVTPRHSDVEAFVDCFFSTDGRWGGNSDTPPFKAWTCTGERAVLKTWTYHRGVKQYTDKNQTQQNTFYWYEHEHDIAVKLLVISVETYLKVADEDEIGSAVNRALSQTACYHKIPLFPGRIMQCQQPNIRQTKKGMLEFAYVWKSDPGSAGRTFYEPNDGTVVAENPSNTILYPPRPPWATWERKRGQVRTSEDGSLEFVPPRVYAAENATDVIAEDGHVKPNFFWQPDGWRHLPGAPFG